MKLSAKTLFFFIGVISFQAGLTILVLGYFVQQENEKQLLKALEENASSVYEQYNEEKKHIWKYLITIKRSESLQKIVDGYRQEGDLGEKVKVMEKMIGLMQEITIPSNLDYVVVKTTQSAVVRSVNNHRFLSNTNRLLPSQFALFPYVALNNFDSTLTLQGRFNLGGPEVDNLEVILLKMVDQQFFNNFTKSDGTQIRIHIDKSLEPITIQDNSLKAEIPFAQLSNGAGLLKKFNVGESDFYGIAREVEELEYHSEPIPVFLLIFLSGKPYQAQQLLIYKILVSVFLAGGLIAALISFFLSRNITMPIEELSKAMRLFKIGQWNSSITSRASKEMEHLFEGFNDMSSNLIAQKATMEKYVQSIELLKDYNEHLFNSIRSGILATDQGYEIKKVNQSFLNLFPLLDDSILGQNVRAVLPDFFDQHLLDQIEELLTSINSVFSTQKRMGTQTFEIQVYPLPTPGEPDQVGRLLLLANISQKVELDEKIFLAEKLATISMLSAGIAHEINNPLSSIINHVQCLIKDESDEENLESLRWMEQESFRISEIIKQLLDFSSNQTQENKVADANEVISEVLRLIDYSLKDKVQIHTRLEDDLPGANIGKNELRQITINMLTNAIDACEGEGDITIQTQSEKGKNVWISFQDNGEGIPEEICSSIFDPFYSTKAHGKGTGLGLSVVYGIIQKNQGSIKVDSTPGQGTTFDIRFPLKNFSTPH